MSGTVVAIVVNYNTATLTGACVASLAASPGVGAIIVVDNASAMDELKDLRLAISGKAELVELDQNYGFSIANNVGVRAALSHQPEWLLFLNSDTELRAGAIDAILDAGTDPAVGAVQLRLLSAANPDIVQLGAATFRPITGHVRFQDVNVARDAASTTTVEVDTVNGGAMAIRTAGFLDAGGFPDDLFMYAEDVELSLRLRRKGWRLRYQPAAEVVHHGGASGGGYMSPFAIYHSMLSMWRVVRRNYSALVYSLHLAYTYLWFLPAFAAYCLLFRRRLVLPFLRAYLHHIAGRSNTPPPVQDLTCVSFARHELLMQPSRGA